MKIYFIVVSYSQLTNTERKIISIYSIKCETYGAAEIVISELPFNNASYYQIEKIYVNENCDP